MAILKCSPQLKLQYCRLGPNYSHCGLISVHFRWDCGWLMEDYNPQILRSVIEAIFISLTWLFKIYMPLPTPTPAWQALKAASNIQKNAIKFSRSKFNVREKTTIVNSIIVP